MAKIGIASGLAIVFVIGVVTQQPAVGQLPPAVGPPVADGRTADPEAVYLAYQEQSITDADFALLLGLVATAVPANMWPRETRRPGESIEALIDRVYDYYPQGRFAKPRTVAAIREAIRSANTDVTGDLSVPPVPVRGFGRYDLPPSIRAFEAERAAYALSQDSQVIEAATHVPTADARGLPAERRASTTLVRLPLNDRVRQYVAGLGSRALPKGVAILSAQPDTATPDGRRVNLVRVEFLDDPATTPCEDIANWLDASPFKTAALARVHATPLSVMLARAQAAPLTVIDTSFSGRGHGAKVRRVIDYVLTTLGVPTAVQHVGVRSFDLVGTTSADREAMRAALDEYVRSRLINVWVLPQVEDTRRWIDTDSPHADEPGYVIPDLLVQAVFWKHLHAKGAVNMSFRVDSPALRLIQQTFVENRQSLTLIAAGNDPGELRPGWLPQEDAGIYPTLVNVTYGSRAGTVWGARSGTVNHTLVSLLGPGCGYDPLGLTDRGTSFASPYVAAAAWVKYLVDGTDPVLMPRILVAAASPVPGEANGVESRGVFDAARLLVQPSPHVVSTDGTIEYVSTPVLEASCHDDKGHHALTFAPGTGMITNIVVYRRGSDYVLWQREIPFDASVETSFDADCVIDSLRFTVNGVVRARSAAAFQTTVRELSL
jgi:hypothetical protein